MQAARFLALLLSVLPACCGAQTSPPQAPPSPRPPAPPSSTSPSPPRANPSLSHDAKLKLLREKVKYVFVLFQENRSFDFYFATYPGADGLYNPPAASIAGFTQPIVNLDGTVGTISPFKIPFSVTDAHGNTVPLYPSDIASVNHAHVAIAHKLDLDANGIARNDRYALTEEGVTLQDGKPSKIPTLERKQFGELVMSHIDCDAAPFLWRYADRFTLFDHFMDTVIGPSTPNAIAMISGQTGETQWMLHPDVVNPAGKSGTPAPHASPIPHPTGARCSTPERTIPQPARQATTQPDSTALHPNLTFASAAALLHGRRHRKNNRRRLRSRLRPPRRPGRHQEDRRPRHSRHQLGLVPAGLRPRTHRRHRRRLRTTPTSSTTTPRSTSATSPTIPSPPPTCAASATSSPTSQNARSPILRRLLCPRRIRQHPRQLKPLDPNPNLATVFNGDDDHPGYSDSQLSEALLAREINAIAASPYWPQSVILIAYDESDGLYDHVRPRVRSHDAAGLPLDQGPRIPAILISPYAVAHGVSHEPAEHSSIIKLVDELFRLIPLADLPDEERARAIGVAKYHQKDLGPADDKVPGVGDLLSGFSNSRLLGRAAPLPPDYAEIPAAEITSFPTLGRPRLPRPPHHAPPTPACPNPIPADFNPRPDTTPGIPTSGNWTP